jgi:hypothetical protein
MWRAWTGSVCSADSLGSTREAEISLAEDPTKTGMRAARPTAFPASSSANRSREPLSKLTPVLDEPRHYDPVTVRTV